MKDFNVSRKTESTQDAGQDLKNKIVYGETRSLHSLTFSDIPGLLHPPFDEGVLADQYRQLKRQLLAKMDKPIALVTSADKGEGKTTASINLAMSFSLERDWQVCLIDCSGSNKNCTEMLGVHAAAGLMDYLESESDNISEFMLSTNHPNVKLLPYGKQSARRYELLTSRKMQSLFKSLPEKFENTVFVIDAPELTYAEAKSLVNDSGSVILVLEQSKTPIAKVKSCLHEINQEKIAGVLFNKASVFSLTD